jgi:IS1 family transposase/lambda repressor-like predicted transcriptional regulator
MNKLSTSKRAQIVAALVEGNSLRATSRMTGAALNTVTKLLVDLGHACQRFHDRTATGLRSRRIQCDEIWAFCYAKEKNLPEHLKGREGFGDVWTWSALDADSKLVVSWLVGERDAGYAMAFMDDVAGRLVNRLQLTTDGHNAYLDAVDTAFGGSVDYAQLVKLYGVALEAETRYSPAKCIGCRRSRVIGNPDPAHVSTSYSERLNLTTRMSMRRFTRLTNAFSKKVENLEAAVALHFVYYNFGRVHRTLRVTPAMEAGIADHIWSLEEIVGLLNSN